MKRVFVLLGLLVATPIALANQLSGVVLSEQGLPIEGALIEVVGSAIRTESDRQGRFVLDKPFAKGGKLHVNAAGFTHKIFKLENIPPAKLELVLNPTALDVINVVALPWHASNIESAQPVSVLNDQELRRRQSSTLGDTLKYQVGVHSSYYGPVASSPIIRGLDGPRVLVAQNGLDAGDASRVGPDHAVATEASTARQIEILRGPATLFYGSGAIGGVVNIVDDRIPQSNATQGQWRMEQGSVADDKLLSGSITTGAEDIGLHLDGFWRDASDYKIPEAGGEKIGQSQQRLRNSAHDAQGVNLGGSYFLDTGYVGVSVERHERRYGIPGHSHGQGEEIPVHAELEQDRLQMASELHFDQAVISGINTRVGYTDYAHDEMEFNKVATTFTNKNYEARLDILHHPLADWRGAATLHYKRSDFSALGAEAFTPPSITENWALALLEERHFGELLLQLGGRAEQVNISADHFIVDLEQRYQGELLSVYDVDYAANPLSLSAGGVWGFAPGYNLALSLTHSQRAPSAAELLSFGPHIGSGLFEVGAFLTVVPQAGDDFYFALQRGDIALEKANNIDISVRKYEGDIGFTVNLFYNAVDNYYFLGETFATQKIAELHGDHFHDFSMPVYSYQAQDANLYGFEGQLSWQLAHSLKITLTSDYIRAQLRRGGDLPRIPPLRAAAGVLYQLGDLELEFNANHYFKQSQVAAFEAETAGYTLLDLHLNYELARWLPGVSLYLKGQNLSNEYARVHSSFLKEKAPLPARSVALGISGVF
ncbi:MAG TPA: TonB-dependent receptor [Cellvibrio sp.]|nr:TonB-dependent receptor [Cellvibrio sp.]